MPLGGDHAWNGEGSKHPQRWVQELGEGMGEVLGVGDFRGRDLEGSSGSCPRGRREQRPGL